jgi:hypothetical protein
MKKYSVYKHIFPNKKVYIGITGTKPEKRWKSNGSGYYNQTLVFKAILKYGWDNVKHEVLFIGLTKEEAEQKEIELISQYKSTNVRYGYNNTNGGNCIGSVTDEVKEKIRASNKGRICNPAQQIKVFQYDFDGNFIEEHESIRIAAKKTGTCEVSIQSCIKGRRESSNKYIWKSSYCGKNIGKFIEPLKRQRPIRNRPVNQLDKNDIFIAKYESITKACIETNISSGNISMCLTGKRPYAGGYKWKYADKGVS